MGRPVSNGALSGSGALQRRAEPEPHHGARASRFVAALAAVRSNAPLDASDARRAPRSAVSSARFPPLVASSDAATLESVTGLCDVAASSALWAPPSRGESMRRGGRVTRAAHLRPRARAGENTRRAFRLRSAGAHQGLRAAKAGNRFGKSAAVTVHTRQAHPPVQEGVFDRGNHPHSSRVRTLLLLRPQALC